MTEAMNIVYKVHNGLYVNLTNRCSCHCTFCLRNEADGAHGSDTLWLEREPSAEEVLEAMEALPMETFDEVVFCGFGEPTEALENLLKVAKEVKKRWGLPVRVNTNGQGSLIAGYDITPELAPVVDAVSVSLNTPNADDYLNLTRSKFGDEAFPAMLEFAQRAADEGMAVTLTTVGSTITPEEESQAQAIADSIGATYRIRPWV